MTLKYRLYLLFIFFITFNCVNGTDKVGKEEILENYISSQVAKILEKRHGLQFCGIGGRNDKSNKIKTFALSFQLHQILNLEACRTLVVDCVQEFKNKINENSELKQYLADVPITVNNIVIEIFFKDKEGVTLYDPNICAVISEEGVIEYYFKDPEKKQPFKKIIQESFEEALSIVKSQQN